MNSAARAVFENLWLQVRSAAVARGHGATGTALSLCLPSIDTFHRSARKKYVKVAFVVHVFVARSAKKIERVMLRLCLSVCPSMCFMS